MTSHASGTAFRLFIIAAAAFAIACSGGGMMHGDSGPDATGADAITHDASSNLALCLASYARSTGMDAGTDADATTRDAVAQDVSQDIAAHDVGDASADVADAAPMPLHVALGDEYSCVLMSDGTVQCWGGNQDGEMADGTTTSHLTPAPIAGIRDAVQLATGGRHACVITRSGTTRCWGRDVESQIGIGVVRLMPLLPTDVPCITDIQQLSAGGAHTCTRSMPGDVYCWGSNDYGQVGDGTTIDRGFPTTIGPVDGALQLAAGDSHTCVLMSDGTLRCWGDDTFGQLGLGFANMIVPTPTAVPGLARVQHIAAGGFHTCAILTNGTAKCWGHNNAGQLGDGTMQDQPSPANLSGVTMQVAQLALGSAHTCARLMDGTLSCWGWNQSGQLGNATASVEPMPTPVAGIANVTDVAAGGSHTCALTTAGAVYCWGDNSRGQIGDGTHTLRVSPTMITLAP